MRSLYDHSDMFAELCIDKWTCWCMDLCLHVNQLSWHTFVACTLEARIAQVCCPQETSCKSTPTAVQSSHWHSIGCIVFAEQRSNMSRWHQPLEEGLELWSELGSDIVAPRHSECHHITQFENWCRDTAQPSSQQCSQPYLGQYNLRMLHHMCGPCSGWITNTHTDSRHVSWTILYVSFASMVVPQEAQKWYSALRHTSRPRILVQAETKCLA